MISNNTLMMVSSVVMYFVLTNQVPSRILFTKNCGQEKTGGRIEDARQTLSPVHAQFGWTSCCGLKSHDATSVICFLSLNIFTVYCHSVIFWKHQHTQNGSFDSIWLFLSYRSSNRSKMSRTLSDDGITHLLLTFDWPFLFPLLCLTFFIDSICPITK